MARILIRSNGDRLILGQELGRGGEGAVFLVEGSQDYVAKIYHESPTSQKQAKLELMASQANAGLLDYAAWPTQVIRDQTSKAVVGFLMKKVAGKKPIHLLYSPAHRKQEISNAHWGFLVFAARNLAAAFEAVHAAGHVLGDVNQGNVQVGTDSRVILIDTDSFQIQAAGQRHLCEVGVGHFTPPELQSLKSFNGAVRTENHDNFGLAILVFHLLFGGRHPYSGVPLRSGVGDTLEDNIKHYRFAYGPDAAQRGLKPPPGSLPMDLVPPTLVEMFRRAFLVEGTQLGRPSAENWKVALDALRIDLTRCGASSMHLHSKHLIKCPWCELEEHGIVYFTSLAISAAVAGKRFSLDHFWQRIELIKLPAVVPAPIPVITGLTATPIPSVASKGWIAKARGWVVLTAVVALIISVPDGALLWVLGGACLLFATLGEPSERKAEHERRVKELRLAKLALEDEIKLWNRIVSEPDFHKTKSKLVDLRDAYIRTERYEATEIKELQYKARQHQLNKYLQQFHLDQADLKGIKSTGKAALASFGIETAADIEDHRISQVPGFGPVRIAVLMGWRASKEKRFVYDHAKAVSPSDIAAISHKFEHQRRTLQLQLSAEEKKLSGVVSRVELNKKLLIASLSTKAAALAQAEIDLSPFKK